MDEEAYDNQQFYIDYNGINCDYLKASFANSQD